MVFGTIEVRNIMQVKEFLSAEVFHKVCGRHSCEGFVLLWICIQRCSVCVSYSDGI